MPKRKRDEEDYVYLGKKLKKLKRRLKGGRHRRSDSSLSSYSDSLPHHNLQECESFATADDDVTDSQPQFTYWRDYWPDPDKSDDDDREPPAVTAAAALPPNAAVPASSPVAAAVAAAVTPTVQSIVTIMPPQADTSVATYSVVPPPTAPVENEVQDSTIDPDLLAILGEDPTIINEFGDVIQNDLAIRLNHLATAGLTKEKRTEIKDKYLIPSNCKMIKAPTLNSEIRASLIESQAKRDKGIENKQILNACALSSLSKAITLLLASDSKNQEVLKLLMDTARILGDIQHSDSMLRRFFVLSTVKKDLKDQLVKTKIEDLLFGSNLVETLKSAKTISKTGADMRSSAPTNEKAGAPISTRRQNKYLNSQGPPASRRPAHSGGGGSRHWRSTQVAPTPRRATTTKHHSSSTTSSRHQYPRHRR